MSELAVQEKVRIECKPGCRAAQTPAAGRDWVAVGAFVSVAAGCLLVSPPVGLAIGIAYALLLKNPLPEQSTKASKFLLHGSVALMGFGMDLGTVLRTGAEGMLFALLTIATTLLAGLALSRLLGVERQTSALISAGTAICGGSAIAAVGSTIGASQAAMGVSIATVFVLNAIALYVFPLIGHALGLGEAQFGVWAGVAIHDVSSVVGAASAYGAEALQTAATVKLSRTLWIIPVAALMGALMTKRSRATVGRKLPIPWFIGGFLLASAARSLVPAIAGYAPWLVGASKSGLTATLFLIGSGLSWPMLRQVGLRPLVEALVLWTLLAGLSLATICYLPAQ